MPLGFKRPRGRSYALVIAHRLSTILAAGRSGRPGSVSGVQRRWRRLGGLALSVLSMHSWSLQGIMGPLHWTCWDESSGRPVVAVEPRPQLLTVLELPARLHAMEIQACELGHFHLPPLSDITPAYAAALRDAFAAASVALWSVVVDYGDLSSADPRRVHSDSAYLQQWLHVGALLGARYVRLVAGDGDPQDPDAMERAVSGFRPLGALAASLGVGLLTENFRRLCSTAAACETLCDRLGGRIGLTVDFGNFPRAVRHPALAAILPRARSIHAKAECDADGRLDADEFAQCLDLAVAAGFDQAYSVVYQGPGDPWDGVARTAELIRNHPQAMA